MDSLFWRFLVRPVSSMYAIVPIKPFNQAKTRLASALSLLERMELSRYLLERTIRLAGQVGEVVVISRDKLVRRLAKRLGAWALVEAEPDLNKALRQAVGWVKLRNGQAVLILPGDLPHLRVVDLENMIEAGQPSPSVVIAPSGRLDGTNALLLRPPDLIPFSYGPNSFDKHCQAARTRGLEPIIYRSATLAFDLDLPEDLVMWREKDWQVAATNFDSR
jgi:2-phospho-L-lactate guanylyltransferase